MTFPLTLAVAVGMLFSRRGGEVEDRFDELEELRRSEGEVEYKLLKMLDRMIGLHDRGL